MNGSYERKTSIVIPVYNQACFLNEAIASAVGQTYKNFEVIVVNDGSTDDSYDVAKGWGIKVVNQSNKGLSGARNAGVLNSDGDLLLMLDADDWVEKDYLEKTIPLMGEGVAVVTTGTAPFGHCTESLWDVGSPTLGSLMQNNGLVYCSLMRRTAFLETGGYNPRMTWGYEDWNLWIDITKRGWKIATIREPLFHYRVKEISMYTEATKHHNELVTVIHALHPDLFGGM
jgi:glycosyltransferase involved in cell wall biosynthesis